MKISDFLGAADVAVDLKASGKQQLLRELAQKAAGALHLAADPIAAELVKRESLGSTGLGGGVAIPHARFADLKAPHAVLVRLRRAIDFEAIDGQPVDIVFLLLLPSDKAGEQLNALASVARRLRNADVLRSLRGAADAAAMYSVMCGE